MNHIFKRIKSFFTGRPSDMPDVEFEEFRKIMDELPCMIEKLAKLAEKEAMQRKEIEALQDYILKMGLDIPGQYGADMTALEEDGQNDLLSMYGSIIRKLLAPVMEECEKAGTDAVDDLVKTVDKQMMELS